MGENVSFTNRYIDSIIYYSYVRYICYIIYLMNNVLYYMYKYLLQ